MSFTDKTEPWRDQLKTAYKKLIQYSHLPKVDFENYEDFVQINFISDQYELPNPEDFKPRILPKRSCRFEVAALMMDEDRQLNIVTEIWNNLSETHKAALMGHEDRYYNARSAGKRAKYLGFGEEVTNSNKVRKLIGAIFADIIPSHFESSLLFDFRAGAPAKVCTIIQTLEKSKFMAIPIEKGKSTVDMGSFTIAFENTSQLMTKVVFENIKNSDTEQIVFNVPTIFGSYYGSSSIKLKDNREISIYCQIREI